MSDGTSPGGQPRLELATSLQKVRVPTTRPTYHLKYVAILEHFFCPFVSIIFSASVDKIFPSFTSVVLMWPIVTPLQTFSHCFILPAAAFRRNLAVFLGLSCNLEGIQKNVTVHVISLLFTGYDFKEAIKMDAR